MTVDIIIATYNGEKYIREQVESILNQTYKNFHLYIRDDGSTDKTKDIIYDLKCLDDRIILIEDDIINNGVGENFKILLKHCSADYVFIADQDDVWEKSKIEELLSFAIKNLPTNSPGIAYAPGYVVDEHLYSSKLKMTNTDNKVKSLGDMILMNGGVQGCAMVINRCLYQMVLRTNFYWYMHDQVLSLYAICFGYILFFPKPLFRYRQHSNNVLGYNSGGVKLWFKKYIRSRRNTFLINKHTDKLFCDFFSSESFRMRKNQHDFFFSYMGSRKNKVKFLYYIITNKIFLRGKLTNAIIKTLLVKDIVER
ncbi:glycosyltransferase [Escherichia coli]|nr:glycosyltransferase [Escherichia coli]EFG6206985.1 glycosyltransferase [Escherichia coli]